MNAPYIWMQTPKGMTSWGVFDYLLEKANVVGTPGSGFGPSGEGYFRLTSFGTYESTYLEAIERDKNFLYKANSEVVLISPFSSFIDYVNEKNGLLTNTIIGIMLDLAYTPHRSGDA